MVQGAVKGSSSEKLHPFFLKGAGRDSSAASSADSTLASTQPVTLDGSRQDSLEDGGRRKRRKKTSAKDQDEDDPEASHQAQRRGSEKSGEPLMDDGMTGHQVALDPPSSITDLPTATQTAARLPTPPSTDSSTAMPRIPLGMSNPSDRQSASDTEPGNATPLKQRVLRFNPKTGTLGAPPKPKQERSPSLLVIIRYGRDEEDRKRMGDKVTQILDGKLQILDNPTKKRGGTTCTKSEAPSTKEPITQKSTHPFFSSKPKQPPPEQAGSFPSKDKSSALSTPSTSGEKPKAFAADTPGRPLQFGFKSSGAKLPRAINPMWPAAGMSHVRGDEPCTTNAQRPLHKAETSRKSKGQVTTISLGESILSRLLDHVDLDAVRRSLPTDEDSFAPAPAGLRLPKRRFESGRQLRRRIQRQLSKSVAALSMADDSSHDELSGNPQQTIHPAIRHHYHSLETRLSALDMSSCEGLSWTAKYCPTTAAQVLQTGKEAAKLKQWLEAMKVLSVDTGGEVASKSKSDGAPKRKRRKNKLDGFVVDSDEEDGELDELSNDDEDDASDESLAAMGVRKSLIQSLGVSAKSSKDQRLKNTVVISGPHGCGKTAAVYAVAKELDFEVFEINPGSRRSGKDILERVGDMTRNHLVRHHRTQSTAAASDDDIDDKVAEEIKSGKQGTVATFFKQKPPAAAGKQGKRREKESPGRGPTSSGLNSQRQSLILLEEADVLYEEDKQFWATVMAMMVQSKRPFIVTCNDENLVPLQSLSLHGIFRFQAPPANLAVDLCLLIAANEGHALGRAAVESLYRSRGNDLRAAISELNYWCQIGVGDRRGGSDWFYSRWPKGSDIDEHGDVVRVVSEGTYLAGMGWIGRDLVATASGRLAMEEEFMHQSWDSWKVDMGDWLALLDLRAPALAASRAPSPSQGRLVALTAYDNFYDSMSAADVCCSGRAFGTMLQEQLDPTLPALPSKTKDDFTIGQTLLEVDMMSSSTLSNAAISMSLKYLGREILGRSMAGLDSTADSSSLRAVDEPKAISLLDSFFRTNRHQLTRLDVAGAFDPIAVSSKAQPSSHLEPSVFDRTMKLILLDIAPWVRGIVAFDDQRMQERKKLSNLLSQGGKTKRMRTTRSAYSALEGGERRLTRKERYFGHGVSTYMVMRTGAKSYPHDYVPERPKEIVAEETMTSSPDSADSPF
ncbi:hypothetical protein RJ55_07575 [Drechmeria coniospora]|nr:hypothetical protein RJ55_07575 [Drechmeria coniospora]